MTSKSKLIEAQNWLLTNSHKFLPVEETLLDVIILSSEIRRDPKVLELGIKVGNRHEVKPNLFFVCKNKDGKNLNIGIAEVAEKALGLTSLGVMQAYSRMVEPQYSIILCENSLSREMLELKANPIISNQIFSYADNKEIILLDMNN